MAAALHARLVRELGWPAALHAALTAIAATARGDTCNASMGADVETGLEQLGRYGQVDAATGLPNRIALREAIELGIQECSWGHPPFTVWFADVDGFKAINDTYGHIAGDQVLTALGSAMRHALPAHSMVARFGGDEFAGLTPASPEAVAQWLDQIRTVRAGGQRIAVSLSVGAIAYTGGLATADSLIAEADQRMLVGRRGIVRDRHTLVAKQQEAH
jgi:diguanylate cyclase (GGDEF)-like protein